MEPWDYTLLGLAVVIFGIWCFSFFLHILSIIYGKWRLHRKVPAVLPDILPGVSILKPIVGVDPNLFENLETFFNMKYPSYELLFCIQDESDAAIMVVQSLINKYPKVDAKLFLGGKKVGVNPKINNMVTGYDAAKFETVLISDSRIKMAEDTLLDMVLTMTEKVGIVHQMPYACTRKGFPSHLEKVYFGTQHAKMYLVSDCLGINCCTGMSCLIRKDVLEKAGGLRQFGQYLAEDYFLSQAFINRGWKVCISSQTARQNCGTYSMTDLHNRLLRWIQLRTSMVPTLILLEPISQCLIIGSLASWASAFLFDSSPLVFFLIHLLAWFLLDYILISIIEHGDLPFSKFDFVVGWLLNEVSYIFLILRSHFNSKIVWRNRTFRLRWGGIIEELHSKQNV
ncbi:hypothetical protein ScPMuIL_007174 [Solemya velum]